MIESFLKYLRFEKRYSAHTLEAYASDIDQFSNFISEKFSVTDIQYTEHNHIRAWVVDMVEKGNSHRTINRKLATLRALFKFLLKRETISKDPSLKVKSLKISKKLPSFVKENDMVSILDHVEFEEGFKGRRDQIILELLYGTGIRLSELIELRFDDVDHSQNTIKVLGKRNKERIIPLTQGMVNLIQEYRQQLSTEFDNPQPFVVVTDNGEKSYPMLIYRIVKKYLDLFVTIDKRSPHVLRHTYATHLLNKGADLNAVKDLLGHSSLAATQVYTHNSIEKLKNVFDKAHPKA